MHLIETKWWYRLLMGNPLVQRWKRHIRARRLALREEELQSEIVRVLKDAGCSLTAPEILDRMEREISMTQMMRLLQKPLTSGLVRQFGRRICTRIDQEMPTYWHDNHYPRFGA
ncbi:MAG: hypothetical protein HQL56_08180 [Magnetococcales bacterium]|nr:hypothetical protein [Magnetococcales bacterium]